MLKKFTTTVLLIVLIFGVLPVCAVYDITPTARAAIMIDAESGAILYSKNADERLGMASTTKIMTGILALEYGNLNDVYTVPQEDYWVEGSSLYLNPGEKVTLETLLYGLLLKSGNDAALAIARHISGSESSFVNLMNEKAAELGLSNTKFANPHGLYAEDHYTTAAELAKLAFYAMKNPVFAKIVATEQHEETTVDDRDGRIIYNANKLISLFPEATGIKPGYTPETGRTLVGSASKNGISVITVTLDCSDDWNEHKMMFEHAFNNFDKKTVLKKGDSLGTFRVKNGNYGEVGVVVNDDITILVSKSGNSNFKIELDSTHLTAPIQNGQTVGKARICFDNGLVHEVDVVVNGDVPVREKNFFAIVWKLLLALFGVE